jgi:hypothetical protein
LRPDLGAPSIEYTDEGDGDGMDFAARMDDEDRSSKAPSMFEKILRKHSNAGQGHSLPNTRISELSHMANISQEELHNMSVDRK